MVGDVAGAERDERHDDLHASACGARTGRLGRRAGVGTRGRQRDAGRQHGLRRADEGRRLASDPVLLRGLEAAARERGGEGADAPADGRHEHRTERACRSTVSRRGRSARRRPTAARRTASPAPRSSTRFSSGFPWSTSASRFSPQSANSEIDPFVLGSKDENDVQGYAGLPVNVNGLMFDYRADIESAGASYPLAKRYYIAVDSGSDAFTNKSLPGQYMLQGLGGRSRPAGAQARDDAHRRRAADGRCASRRTRSRASIRSRSSSTTTATFCSAHRRTTRRPGSSCSAFRPNAPAIKAAKKKKAAMLIASDNQETKNVNTIGANVLPNTNFKPVKVAVVNKPTVTWLVPRGNAVPARDDAARRRGELDEEAHVRRLPRRREEDRIEEARLRRPFLHGLEGEEGEQGQARLARHGARRARAHGDRASYRARVQVAVITGASSGIGAALARELAKRGWLLRAAGAARRAAARARRGGRRRVRGVRRLGPRGCRRDGGARPRASSAGEAARQQRRAFRARAASSTATRSGSSR